MDFNFYFSRSPFFGLLNYKFTRQKIYSLKEPQKKIPFFGLVRKEPQKQIPFFGLVRMEQDDSKTLRRRKTHWWKKIVIITTILTTKTKKKVS